MCLNLVPVHANSGPTRKSFDASVWQNLVVMFKRLGAPLSKVNAADSTYELPPTMAKDIKEFSSKEHPVNSQYGGMGFTQQ